MRSKENIVNALIKIFKGDIEFTFIGDIWCKFQSKGKEFRVMYLSLLVEECVDKYTLQSNDTTNRLEKRLKEELR